jgi:hypothetical protein
MATPGFLSLAYLGELSAVVSIAYLLELKTFNYALEGKKLAEEANVLIKDSVTAPEIKEIANSSLNVMNPDKEERAGTWKIKVTGKKTENLMFSSLFVGYFLSEYDKNFVRWAFVTSCALIFTITVLDRTSFTTSVFAEPTMWWVLFSLFSLCVAVPAVSVIAGWKVKSDFKRLQENYTTRYAEASDRTVTLGVKSVQDILNIHS